MTTKKTVRKPKTFWAVLADEPWGKSETAVRVFPSHPSNLLTGWWWLDRNGGAGGLICVQDFTRITGIRLTLDTPVEIAFTARIV